MELSKLYRQVENHIRRVDMQALWEGFQPLRFALYDEKDCCFDGKMIEKTPEFLANTSIEYHGEQIAIWNVQNDIDPLILASKLIHEMFHGYQRLNAESRFPDELHALLTTVKNLGYNRIICAFQPHTYTRTAALFDQFVEELKLPDVTVLMEIFAAREQNTLGISSNDLAQKIPGSIYCSTMEAVTDKLAEIAQPGDLILTVGAGDIYRAGEMLVRRS